jgi:hypothetical protein
VKNILITGASSGLGRSLFEILQNKYSGRPMRQADDEPDKTDMYQDVYTLSNGNFYNDTDNLTVNKLKQSNFNIRKPTNDQYNLFSDIVNNIDNPDYYFINNNNSNNIKTDESDIYFISRRYHLYK